MAMSQRERAAFLYEAGREGMPIDVARKLLRYGSTLHRLAEAQCNGDWPCDNGERKVEFTCRCGGGYVRSVLAYPAGVAAKALKLSERIRQLEALPFGDQSALMAEARTALAALPGRLCPDCRTTDAVRTLVASLEPDGCSDGCGGAHAWSAECHGDPRGAVLTLKAPSGREMVAG